MNRWITSVVAVAFVAAASAGHPASAQDKVEKIKIDGILLVAGGAPRSGTVTSADFDKVVFTDQKGGKRTELPSADVAEIRWADAPAGYDEGLRALASGDAEGARRAFAEAIQEKGVKPDIREWVTEFANAGLGRALLAAGQADRAVEAFGLARSANAKSMILDQILIGLAEAEMVRNKGDAAAKAADDLIGAAKTAKRPAWELAAYLVKAKGKLLAADFAGAASAYDDAVRFAENAAATEKQEALKRRIQRTGLEAAVMKGWTLVSKGDSTKSAGDYEAARSYFDGLAAKHPGDPLVAASASNAAGAAKLAAGDAKAALRLFMTTEVVHFEARDEVARSLWYQAECWRKLGGEQQRADRLKDLKESFPGSEWARRAQ